MGLHDYFQPSILQDSALRMLKLHEVSFKSKPIVTQNNRDKDAVATLENFMLGNLLKCYFEGTNCSCNTATLEDYVAASRAEEMVVATSMKQ